VLILSVLAASARADLYRWIDPDTGSVKFSSLPPSDPRVNAEVVTARSTPLPKPAAASPSQAVAPLETRWREALARLSTLTPQELASMSESLRQQLDAYQALSVELDRLDPEGSARRQQEAMAVLQRLQKASTK
jgi:hypothetical protein